MISATSAATGVISDSRATVETIRAFEVNRIVYREYFNVDLCARNGLNFVKMQKTLNIPAPQSGTSVRKCCPNDAGEPPAVSQRHYREVG